MIITQGNLNALFQAYKLIFQQTFNNTQIDWDKIAMMVPSSTARGLSLAGSKHPFPSVDR
jgi:phage major head subunit gpT-like protein